MDGNGRPEVDDFIRNLQLMAFLTRHYVERRFVDKVTRKPISFVHINLLRILEQHPGRTVGEVARFMSVTYPAATKTIEKLIRLGLVERREDAKDRRIAHLHLTPNGKSLVTRYTKLKRNQIEQIIGDFGREDAALLSDHMHKFARCIVGKIPIRAGVCMQCGAFSPEDCVATVAEKTCGYLDKSDGDV